MKDKSKLGEKPHTLMSRIMAISYHIQNDLWVTSATHTNSQKAAVKPQSI